MIRFIGSPVWAPRLPEIVRGRGPPKVSPTGGRGQAGPWKASLQPGDDTLEPALHLFRHAFELGSLNGKHGRYRIDGSVGDRSSPLRPVTGEGNVGISNAVLRNQPEVRALRVVVEPGGTGSTITAPRRWRSWRSLSGEEIAGCDDGRFR